jgi:hypothetical protein
MFLKTAIAVLFILMLTSLGAGLYFLMAGKGDSGGRHLLTSLALRALLAVALLALIAYGFMSGQLHSQAPW